MSVILLISKIICGTFITICRIGITCPFFAFGSISSRLIKMRGVFLVMVQRLLFRSGRCRRGLHTAEQLGKLLHRHAVLTHHADDVGVLQLTNLLFQLAVAALQIGNFAFVLLQLSTELHNFRVHIVDSPLRQAPIAVEMGLPIA